MSEPNKEEKQHGLGLITLKTRQKRWLAGATAGKQETKTFLAWCKPVAVGVAHTQTHRADLGFLCLPTTEEQPGHLPSLITPLLQHSNARAEAVPLGHRIFSSWTSETLPSRPHCKALEQHLSTDICSPAKHFSSLCQRSCSQKKLHFVVRKAGWDGRLWLLGFLACWKHHFFLPFLARTLCWQMTREEDSALSICSSWKSMLFSEESPRFHYGIVPNSLETMQQGQEVELSNEV